MVGRHEPSGAKSNSKVSYLFSERDASPLFCRRQGLRASEARRRKARSFSRKAPLCGLSRGWQLPESSVRRQLWLDNMMRGLLQ